VLLTLHRGVGKPPLDDDSVRAVDRIRGHLERAIRIHLKRSLARPRAVAGHALLEALPYGVLVVDETRQISYRNPVAMELLAGDGPLIDRAGRLDCVHLGGSRDLLAMIHSLGLGGAQVVGLGAERAVIKLPGSSGQPELLVFAIAVRGNATLQASDDDPCAILIVHPLEHPASGGRSARTLCSFRWPSG
jgi:PAS domain-containing protein